MSAFSYEELKCHFEHDIEVVEYGNGANFAIECITCNEVLLDINQTMLHAKKISNLLNLHL